MLGLLCRYEILFSINFFRMKNTNYKKNIDKLQKNVFYELDTLLKCTGSFLRIERKKICKKSLEYPGSSLQNRENPESLRTTQYNTGAPNESVEGNTYFLED